MRALLTSVIKLAFIICLLIFTNTLEARLPFPGGGGGTTTPTPSTPGAASVSPSNSTDGALTVSWGASSGLGLGYDSFGTYLVFESKNGGSFNLVDEVGPTHTSKTLMSRGDGSYKYYVKACNENLNTGVKMCSGNSSQSGTATVRKKPSTPSAPSISTTNSTGSVTVSWSKPSGTVTYYSLQRRKNSGSWSTVVSSLSATSRTVSGLSDGSWDFRVRACNSASWSCSSYSSDSANATVRVRPSSPSAPSVSNSTSTGSVTVSWSKPSGTVSYYNLQRRQGSGSWTNVGGNITATSHTVTSLSDGSWDFRVRACNTASWACSSYGADSANSTVRKKPSTPSKPNISATTSTGSLTVSWSKPSGTVTYYSLQKRNGSGSWSTVTSNTSSTSYTIQLTDGSWDFRVQACNEFSWACSSYSTDSNNSTVRKNPSTPPKPSISTSESTGSVTVSWSKPSGTVSFYSLQKRNGSGSWSTVTSSTSSTSYTVSNLGDGAWTFRVQACNGYPWACSSYSTSSSSSTVRLKPSTPAIPTISSATSTGSVTLSWTKPSGTVSFYKIEKRNNSGSWSSVTLSTSSLSHAIGDLSDGSWDFRVSACNGYWWSCSSFSSDSANAKVRLKPSTPATPSISTTTSTASSVTVSWSKPSGNVSHYQLQRRKGSGSWTNVSTNISGLSKTVTGLTDGTWDFRVSACNDEAWACSGYSADSSNLTVRFKPSTPTAPGLVFSAPNKLTTVSWSKPTGTVTYYNLERSYNSSNWVQDSGITSTSKSYSDLADGTWKLKVQACNEFAWACSSFSSGSTISVLNLPGVPASITVPTTTDTDASHTISWGEASGSLLTAYKLEERLKPYGNSSYGAWEEVHSSTSRSKHFDNRADGDWQYRVRACNATGCGNYKNSSTVTVLRIPYSPVNPTVPSSDADGSYTVSWQAPSSVVSRYEYSESPSFSSWHSVGLATSKQINGKGDGGFSYRVRACNASGCGIYSATNTVTVNHPTPDAPVSITVPAETGEATYVVSWGAATSSVADKYQLAHQHESGSWTAWENKGAVLSAEVTVDNNGFWKHKVRACNDIPGGTKCGPEKISSSVDVKLPPNWAFPNGTVADQFNGHIDTISGDSNVGVLEGKAGVSGGAANYSVPVALPPGRKGMQPSVSMNYSSRSGNGVMGIGFALSAGSSISRCGSIADIDGANLGVQYSTQDKLCLDGKRLVNVSGSYGYSGTVYRTEMDSFVRVTQKGGGINSASTYFEVHTKDNKISVYGNNTLNNYSKVQPEGAPATLSWLIDSTRDYSSNAIHYRYKHGANSGEVLLDRIQYTGTSDGSSNSPGNRVVIFSYEPRTDVSTSYLAGGKSRQTQRLNKVSTHYDGTTIREYNVVYKYSAATNQSLVESIQECAYKNGISSCLPKTDFNWQDAPMTYELEPFTLTMENGNTISPYQGYSITDPRAPNVSHNSVLFDEIMPRGDLNGDGVKDWYGSNSPSHPKGYFFNAEGKQGVEHGFSANNCGVPFAYREELACSFADFNMDGRTDVWIGSATSSQSLKLRYTKVDSNGEVYFGDEVDTEIVTERDYSVELSQYYGYTQPSLIPDISDYNGDGLPDLLVYSSREIFVYLHNGDVNGGNPYTIAPISAHKYLTAAIPAGPHVAPQDKNAESISNIGDVDGNGLPDLLLVKTIAYSESSGSNYFLPQPRPKAILLTQRSGSGISFINKDLTQHCVNGYYFKFIDVNADGLSDFICSDGSGTTLSINEGNADFSSRIPLGVDLGLVRNLKIKSGYEYSGDGLAQKIMSEPVTEYRYAPGFKVADINGDGKTELLIPNQRVIESCLYAYAYDLKEKQNKLTEFCANDEVDTPLLGGLYGKYMYEEYFTVPPACSTCAPIQYSRTYLKDMPGAQQDDSIYQYDAIYFDENPDGSIATRKEDSGFVGPLKQGAFIDTYGNGLTDFVFTYGPTNEDSPAYIPTSESSKHAILQRNFDTYVYRNRGSASGDDYAPVNMLKSVVNGFAHKSEWEYKPLSTGKKQNNNLPLYASDYDQTDTDSDYFHFASSMYVVSDFKQSDGIGGDLTTQYRYKGAMYNVRGRGFQGFNQVAVDSLDSGLRSVTDFHQKYPLAGQVKQARSCLITDNSKDCSVNPINKTTVSDYHVINTTSKSKWVIAGNSVKEEFDLANRNLRLSKVNSILGNQVGVDIDTYGNVLLSTQIVDDGFGVVTSTTTNQFDTGAQSSGWWNKLLETKVDTSQVSNRNTTIGAPTATGTDYDKWTKTNFVYSGIGQTHRIPNETLTSASDTSLTHKVVIDSVSNYGLPTSITTHGQKYDGSNLTTRQVSTVYSNDGYFPQTVTQENGGYDLISSSTVSPIHGQVKVTTDPNGISVTTTYDPFGRVESQTVPGGKIIETGYQWCTSTYCPDSKSKYLVFTKQEGSPTVKTYKDQLNRDLMVETQGFGGQAIYTRMGYDALGRKVLETKPSFDSFSDVGTRYLSFDPLGRLTHKETDQANYSTMTTIYSYTGHQTNITASDRGTILEMSKTYSGTGKLMRTVDAMLGQTRYAYDGTGNPITLMDANNNPIHAWYNGLGHKTKVDDPNMGIKTFAYNTFGEVEREQDANGNILAMSYDRLGRMYQRTINSSLDASWTFDSRPNGLGLAATENGVGISKLFSYDNLSRPVNQTTTIDGFTYNTLTEYDSNYGRVKAVQYPSDIKVATEYDPYGYQTKLINAGSGFVYQEVTQRDALLNLTQSKSNAGSLTEQRFYWPESGQMRNITVSTTNGDSPLHKLWYDYSAFGNLAWQEQWYKNGAQWLSSREDYQYDNLHRLRHSYRTFDGSHTESPIDYDYDAVGNLTLKTDYAATLSYGNNGKSLGGNAGPNAVRQIAKLLSGGGTTSVNYTYDNNGNLQSGDGKSITYNAFNKPITITKNGAVSAFNYGADLMRYKQVKSGSGADETTIYLDKLVEIVTKGNLKTTKTYIGDVAIVTKEESSASALPSHKIAFTHRDRLGSVITLTDHVNNVFERRSYDPFGKPRKGDFVDVAPATITGVVGGKPFTPRGFTDHEHLDDAELIHMNGRAYDYNLGRFLSVDPFVQAPGNSQSMNPYSYIMNNPLAGTDPSGYKSICRIGKSETGNCQGEKVSNSGQSDDAKETNNGKTNNTSSSEVKVTIIITGSQTQQSNTQQTNQQPAQSGNPQSSGATPTSNTGGTGKQYWDIQYDGVKAKIVLVDEQGNQVANTGHFEINTNKHQPGAEFSLVASIAYLEDKGSATVFRDILKSGNIVKVNPVDPNSSHSHMQAATAYVYASGKRGITFDFTEAIRLSNGSAQSPALGFYHEAVHVWNEISNPGSEAALGATMHNNGVVVGYSVSGSPVYQHSGAGNEQAIITGKETIMANRLGEGVRSWHSDGTVYNVNCAICR
ncbi:MAG: VCBS repeat-containing protein [Gammaproteobacteria bacterium]|nr:VCBS repeat-containing protein [Gammaproteobacteria bacterium]